MGISGTVLAQVGGGNRSLIVLPSKRRFHTPDVARFAVYSSDLRGVIVTANVAAVGAGGTVAPTVQGLDPASGTVRTLLAAVAISGATNRVLEVHPEVTASANLKANEPLPPVFQITCTHDTASDAYGWKDDVRLATTAALTLATDFHVGSADVDGVALALGDRILIKDQADAKQNGIYTVNAAGAPTRATDADAAVELNGSAVEVLLGTTNAVTAYKQTAVSPVPGTDNITYSALVPAVTYSVSLELVD